MTSEDDEDVIYFDEKHKAINRDICSKNKSSDVLSILGKNECERDYFIDDEGRIVSSAKVRCQSSLALRCIEYGL